MLNLAVKGVKLQVRKLRLVSEGVDLPELAYLTNSQTTCLWTRARARLHLHAHLQIPKYIDTNVHEYVCATHAPNFHLTLSRKRACHIAALAMGRWPDQYGQHFCRKVLCF